MKNSPRLHNFTPLRTGTNAEVSRGKGIMSHLAWDHAFKMDPTGIGKQGVPFAEADFFFVFVLTIRDPKRVM